jgi:hypothetical protein
MIGAIHIQLFFESRDRLLMIGAIQIQLFLESRDCLLMIGAIDESKTKGNEFVNQGSKGSEAVRFKASG